MDGKTIRPKIVASTATVRRAEKQIKALFNRDTVDIFPPPGPDRLGLLMRTLLTKRIRMQGFIIFDDYGDRFREFLGPMSRWVTAGEIKFREDIVDGLENAPQAFIGLLQGRNFGKLVVRVAHD